MYFVRIFVASSLLLITSCANMFPDATDLRHLNQGATIGTTVPDLPVLYTDGTTSSLHSETLFYRGVVLYFTMWCSVCTSHTDHMRSSVVASHPDVLFIIVDYVSGDITETQNLAAANSYNADFSVAFDQDSSLTTYFNATMGTTIVIDSQNVVQMHEDYKAGTALAAVLQGL